MEVDSDTCDTGSATELREECDVSRVIEGLLTMLLSMS